MLLTLGYEMCEHHLACADVRLLLHEVQVKLLRVLLSLLHLSLSWYSLL